MSIRWTPSGPIVQATTSSTSFVFHDQTEGVARLINVGTSVGLASFNDPNLSLEDKFMPIMPGEILYAAFGSEQTALEITGSQISITPGYMLKDGNLPLFDLAELNPAIWLDFGDITTLYKDRNGTIPALLPGDIVNSIRNKGWAEFLLSNSADTKLPGILRQGDNGVHYVEAGTTFNDTNGTDFRLTINDILAADQPHDVFASYKFTVYDNNAPVVEEYTSFRTVRDGGGGNFGYFLFGALGTRLQLLFPDFNDAIAFIDNVQSVFFGRIDGVNSVFNVNGVDSDTGLINTEQSTVLAIPTHGGNLVTTARDTYKYLLFDYQLSAEQIILVKNYLRSSMPT